MGFIRVMLTPTDPFSVRHVGLRTQQHQQSVGRHNNSTGMLGYINFQKLVADRYIAGIDISSGYIVMY